jgi:hypothetical protein
MLRHPFKDSSSFLMMLANNLFLILGILVGMQRYPFKDSVSFSTMLAKNPSFFLFLRFWMEQKHLRKRHTQINKRQLSLFDS